jgi:hypothetical protein
MSHLLFQATNNVRTPKNAAVIPNHNQNIRGAENRFLFANPIDTANSHPTTRPRHGCRGLSSMNIAIKPAAIMIAVAAVRKRIMRITERLNPGGDAWPSPAG